MDISRIKHLAEVGAITQTQLVEYYENHPEELQKLTESDLFGLGIVTRVDDQEVKDSISDPAYSVYKISNTSALLNLKSKNPEETSYGCNPNIALSTSTSTD